MKQRLSAFVLGILAGLCIALGGTAFLSLESKALGALFFCVGLFAICTMGFSLFTGKVCYVFERPGSYALDLPFIWLGNLCGTWLTAKLEQLTRISGIQEKAIAVCQAKLDDNLGSIFILAVFCNILIYLAVEGYANNPHELGKYLSLFFGVTVFILCGFEHCVANMYYFSMANLWSGKTFLYVIVMSLGNATGGVLIPLVKKALAGKPATVK